TPQPGEEDRRGEGPPEGTQLGRGASVLAREGPPLPDPAGVGVPVGGAASRPGGVGGGWGPPTRQTPAGAARGGRCRAVSGGAGAGAVGRWRCAGGRDGADGTGTAPSITTKPCSNAGASGSATGPSARSSAPSSGVSWRAGDVSPARSPTRTTASPCASSTRG